MEINTYTSDSITLCAFMLTQKGVEFIDVQEDNFHHFSFILSNPERCEELRHQYLNNASAPARELFSKREMLIGEIKAKNSSSNKGGKTNE